MKSFLENYRSKLREFSTGDLDELAAMVAFSMTTTMISSSRYVWR
jgi:hypothetical protein